VLPPPAASKRPGIADAVLGVATGEKFRDGMEVMLS
jgi:hypothetical protein